MNKPFEKVNVVDAESALNKAYAAGYLTSKGSLVVYGIGSNQGSWRRFCNIEFRGSHSVETMRNLAHFLKITNVKMSNYVGKTWRHRLFNLTRMADEVEVVARYMGVSDELDEAVFEVDLWDEEHGLMDEMKEKGWQGGIDDWETRSKKVTIPLDGLQSKIMDAVVGNLMDETEGMAGLGCDREQLLANAFIEGLTGLVLGSTDLEALKVGESVAA